MIEEDCGIETSKAIARDLVVYHRRSGGQSQFSTMLELEPRPGRIRDALAYARAHLGKRLSVEQLADVARISPRQFARQFTAETGETPARAIERLRCEAALPRIPAFRMTAPSTKPSAVVPMRASLFMIAVPQNVPG